MAKKTAEKTLQNIPLSAKEQSVLVDECAKHESDSYNYLKVQRETWDDKEAILLCKIEDSLSSTAKSQVFDPILSTMLLERTGRVMYQNPSGKAYAVSKDDVGKNILINLLLKFFRNNANEQFSHLVKLRMLDFYSGVFGSAFGLIPWRLNPYTGYIGPELLLLDIWKCRPQPMKKTINESDWFGVAEDISVHWLIEQNKKLPGIWMNVEELANEMKESKDPGDVQTDREKSYTERELYPSVIGDTKYPTIRAYTEYRRDRWITWCPQRANKKSSRPLILRVVENPYPKGMLPIVAKHAFPLMNSIIGLGEFERGMTLQKSINSLWNLYLDGVKYSIFPPLHINPDEVVPTSIKWGAGERWFMNHPNVDVQTMNLSPRGMDTFQSTYGFMMSAIQNLTGTSVVSQPSNVEPTLGKTPQAIQMRATQMSARDEWDRFMMEDTIKEIYERWIALITHNLKVPQVLRIYEGEIQEIQKVYPKEKILEIFKSGKRGNLTIDNKYFKDNKDKIIDFDFELETGSTMKKNIEDEGMVISSIIQSLSTKVGNMTILEEIRQKGKDVDIAELYKRWVALQLKDYDKIIIEPESTEMTTEQENIVNQSPGQVLPEAVVGQPASVNVGEQFKDEEIANVAQEVLSNNIFGGVSGIPKA